MGPSQMGVQGEVLTHHDAHGLCYEVQHQDGTVGTYDPSELDLVTAKERMKDFFPEVGAYDPRQYRSIDGCVESRELQTYLEKLLGDHPSARSLLDYARRLIDAADVVEEWHRAERAAQEVVDRLRPAPLGSESDNSFSVAFASYWIEKGFDMQLRMLIDFGEYSETTDEHYNERLRMIFEDPEGRYLLGWSDFCHTGRTAPLLHADIMRRVAVQLLNRADDLLPHLMS